MIVLYYCRSAEYIKSKTFPCEFYEKLSNLMFLFIVLNYCSFHLNNKICNSTNFHVYSCVY